MNFQIFHYLRTENNYTVVEDAGENREPLTETVINADHLTIQPINKSRLNPMEVDIINSFVYDFLKSRGTQDVLDPNKIFLLWCN